MKIERLLRFARNDEQILGRGVAAVLRVPAARSPRERGEDGGTQNGDRTPRPYRNDGGTGLGYIVIIAMLVIASIFSINLFFKQKSSHDKFDIHTFPQKIGEWESKDIEISERDYDILETRNLIFREYVNPTGAKIWAFIIYSETNRSVFHPPEVCMLGSGVKILDKKSERMDFDKYKFLANKIYIGDAAGKELVLYCYKVGSFYTENFYLQQGLFALNQLLGKRTGGATVRISAPIEGSEEETLAKLKKFMERVVEELGGL